MRKILLGLMLLAGYFGSAQNNYNACGSQSGLWNYDTVFVSCDIIVPAGEQLIIAPNTTVLFEDYFSIHVLGSVDARASYNQPISFTIADTSGFADYHSTAGGWNGFRFEQTLPESDSSLFEYCRFYYGKAAGDSANGYGGAFRIDNFNKIRIEQCLFDKHYAFYRGGAVYANKSDILIRKSEFLNSFAGNDGMDYGYGGAVAFRASLPEVSGSYFEGNASTGVGGALSFEFSNPKLINCEFYQNFSALGGAIGFIRATPERQVANLLIHENSSLFFGGGIACLEASPHMTNLTIINNSSAMGGGYYCNEHADPVLANSILWNNTAGDTLGSQVWIWDVYSEPEFHYCNIQGGLDWFGGSSFIGVYENNMDADPSFFEQFWLSDDSPCINAGTPDTTGFLIPPTDLLGMDRIQYGRIDMGVMEFIWMGLPQQHQEMNSLAVFPNPLNFSSVCELDLTSPGAVELSIFDLNGRLIWQQTSPALPAGGHQFPLTDFVKNNTAKSSFYLLKVTSGSQAWSQRLIH
ncbi:MAG: T9SS type A sorting domain-containing protein [Bacteroidetes bacterium]|nr:T9SS type A sorting domain-containing protein [Bacteroidota bacterium]